MPQRWRDPSTAARCVLLLRACDAGGGTIPGAGADGGAEGGAGQLTRRTAELLVQAAEDLQQQVGWGVSAGPAKRHAGLRGLAALSSVPRAPPRLHP